MTADTPAIVTFESEAAMMKDLYRRVLLSLAIPLVGIAVVVVLVLDFSRVLLALEGKATLVAVVAASAVLVGATRLSRRSGAAPPDSLWIVITAGVFLVFGGVVALARLDEKAEATAPPNVTITAYGIGFREHQVTVPAGEVRIAYVDDGQLVHTLVIAGGRASSGSR